MWGAQSGGSDGSDGGGDLRGGDWGRVPGSGTRGRRGGAVRRTLRRNRRAVAAAAAGLSILTLGTALQPEPPATRPVVVAAGQLGAGHRLALADLAVARVPEAVLPDGAPVHPEALVGRVLAAPLSRGEVVAPSRLVGSTAFAAVPAGTSPMPIRFADPGAARLLSAGQRVDVLAAGSLSEDGLGGPATAQVVAEDALVLAVVETGEASAMGGGGSQEPLVVLAVGPGAALALAAAQAQDHLSFTMSQPPA